MPIVRLSRDKRGLDTIYLIDTSAEGGRRTGGARVLYFWTAPPALRVGVAALDESAQRALERAHPEMAFDWPALRKAVDAALAQAAALNVEARRDAWRSSGKASRAGQRPSGRGEAGPVTAAPAASTPPPGPTANAARRDDRQRTDRDDQSPAADPDVEAAAPTGTAPPPSEDGEAVARRPRRRRRRSKRPLAGDEAPSGADPIIES